MINFLENNTMMEYQGSFKKKLSMCVCAYKCTHENEFRV